MSAARAPASVDALVRGVCARLRAARVLECALLFAAAALLTRGAAVLSLAGRDAWMVALLAGLLCAAAWWLEHPIEPEPTARELDERLEQRGALATAFDVEQRAPGHRSPMEELVRARVLARMSVAPLVRALAPPLAPPLAALALAALAFVLATEAAPAPAPADPSSLSTGLLRALAAGLEPDVAGAGASSADGPTAAEDAELAALLREAGTLALPAAPSRDERAQARARVEELDARIAALASRSKPGGERRARLAEARTWLDALRQRLAPGAAAPGGSAGGSGTDAPAHGTISGSGPEPEPRPMPSVAPAPSTAPAPTSERTPGRQAGTWWPAEYDAVVERWIELSRAAREGDGAR